MDAEGAPPRIRREARLSAEAVFGPAALAAILEPALVEAAGAGAVCVSVSLEFAGRPAPGSALQIDAWVERATRTLVFAAAEARAEGELAGAASAVFSLTDRR